MIAGYGEYKVQEAQAYIKWLIITAGHGDYMTQWTACINQIAYHDGRPWGLYDT